MVTHTREILQYRLPRTSTMEVLQIVASARNVGGDFDARGQAHMSNLTQSRVRLLRGGGVNIGAHAATQRAALQGQSLGLFGFALTSLTTSWFNSRQLESDSVVSLLLLCDRRTAPPHFQHTSFGIRLLAATDESEKIAQSTARMAFAPSLSAHYCVRSAV